MSRRRRPEKREILPDPKFGDEVLSKFMNSVMFDGKSLLGIKPHEINQTGVSRVFQTPEIFTDLTVLENVMIPAHNTAVRNGRKIMKQPKKTSRIRPRPRIRSTFSERLIICPLVVTSTHSSQ